MAAECEEGAVRGADEPPLPIQSLSGVSGSPHTRRRGAVVSGMVEALSDRELEVLGLVAAGKRNRRSPRSCGAAPDTVKKHVTHILDKLGAANRTEATARARELGLLS